ncbi:GFA family protein [Paractinoplanes ferrugineus]
MPKKSTAATETWTGTCLCGAIRFTVSGEPDFPHLCSCSHCKTRGGSPMQWWIGFPLSSLTWTGEGELTWYDTFPSGTKRGFCPVCGSHIAALDYGDTTIGINVPALDNHDDPRLVPTSQSFSDDAVTWLPRVTAGQHSTGG